MSVVDENLVGGTQRLAKLLCRDGLGLAIEPSWTPVLLGVRAVQVGLGEGKRCTLTVVGDW